MNRISTKLDKVFWLDSTQSESENKKQEPSPADIASLDINQLVEVFVMLLTEKAWRYIGLRVDPRTNKIDKDYK
jgi:hypothetical protein